MMMEAAQTEHEPAHSTAKQHKPPYLWVFLGLVSIVFHLGLIFSGLVPALVARPLHMALALPWLFIFGARSRRPRISGALLMLSGEARMEERRVGKAGVSTCRSRWSR